MKPLVKGREVALCAILMNGASLWRLVLLVSTQQDQLRQRSKTVHSTKPTDEMCLGCTVFTRLRLGLSDARDNAQILFLPLRASQQESSGQWGYRLATMGPHAWAIERVGEA